MVRPLTIVGDTPEAERLEQLLAEWGWACLRAAAGEITATLARTKPPLLLVALAAGEAGRGAAQSLTRRIQATAYGALVPVVFFGPPPGPNPAEVVALGGDVFLPEPVSPEALRDCVRRLAPDPLADRSSGGAAKAGATRTPWSAHPRSTPAPASSLTGATPPAPPDPGDDLAALEQLPWEGLPELDATRRRLAIGLDEANLGLADAMAGDALLDPRALAEAIAAEAPGWTDSGPPEAAPSAREAPAEGEAPAAPPLEVHRAPSPAADRSRGPVVLPEEPSEIDAIVRQFVIHGGDADTVAVKIQKAISSFEDPVSPRATPAEDAMPAGAQLPGPDETSGTPLEEAPQEKMSPHSAPLDDEIDLAALDVDTIAGVDSANPEELLERLSEDRGTPHPPPPGPVTHVTTSAGTRRPHGTAYSIPGPVTGSVPGPLTGSLAGPSRSEDDESVTQPPWRSEADADEAPDRGETRVPAAPLASPYDLPPVVATAGQAPFALERGFRDKLDTVPGRRTAILHGVKPDPADGEPVESADPPRSAEVTQPQRPGSLRERAAAAGAPAAATPPQPSRSQPEAAGVTPAPARGEPPPLVHRTPPPVPAELREGQLEHLDPAALIWRLGRANLTGTLRVEAEGGSLDVVFHDGRVRFATSSRAGDRMLTLLQRRGQISATQADEVEEEIARSGRRAGAILLDRGWIKSAELIPTIRDHLENLVMEVFALERGSFRFRAERPLHDEIVHLERLPAAIVIEGVRRKYEPERIMGLIGATEVTPLKRPEADEGLLEGCPLTGRDWRLIDAMDGRRTISELAADLHTPAHHLWSLAWALHSLGLVALPAAAVTRAGASPATAGAAGASTPPPSDASLEVEIQRILHRRGLIREADYYAVLGAAPDATAAEIAEAYARTRRQLEPPQLPASLTERYAAELHEIHAVLQEAVEVLSDDQLRERYRQHLTRAEGEAGDT